MPISTVVAIVEEQGK